MRPANLLPAAMATLALFLACNRPQTADPLAEARQAITASNAIYFKSFANNDSSIFLDRYAADCRIMAPNSAPFIGREGAETFFRVAYDKFGLRNGRFIITDIYGDGKEYVTEEGVWQSFDRDGKLFDNGKCLVLWKKTSEGWKMFRDSFSSDREQ